MEKDTLNDFVDGYIRLSLLSSPSVVTTIKLGFRYLYMTLRSTRTIPCECTCSEKTNKKSVGNKLRQIGMNTRIGCDWLLK